MEKIFLAVLNMSLTASFVIAVIMLARLLLKNAPKSISYALWAVAGFRLVFPFTLESMFSLLPFKAAPIPSDIAMQAVPRIDSGIGVVDNFISASLPAATPMASANPLQLWLFIGSCVWLAGLAVMVVYSIVSIILLKRRLRGAVCVEGNLYEAQNLKTPFVIGLFKPKIYIPAGLSEEEHGYIVLHERTHIRRRDHAVKMFAYIVLCLHWFNPLAWAAFVLMGADMEMSCDECVMKELGVDIKNAYSLSLVRVAAGRKIINGSPLAFGEGGMKERVKNVLNFKKPSRVVIIAAVALAAVLSVGFAVSRAGVPSEPPRITVTAERVEIFSVVGKNEWNGRVYDRPDNFEIQRERIFNRDMPYVKNGAKISISFGSHKPNSIELSEIILNENGTARWRTDEHAKTYDVSFLPFSGTGTFKVEPNFATSLSSFSGDYAPGNTIKGYKMTCRWGNNECEYAFVILGDAAVIMVVEETAQAEAADSPKMMTLDDVRELSRKFGADLSPEDLDEFSSSYSNIDGIKEWHYPVEGNKWRLEVVVNILEGEEVMTSCALNPVGYEFRPQSRIDIRYDAVDEYIDYVEAYDGSQTQLSDEERYAAHAAALEYYKTTGLSSSEVTYIEDATEYVGAVIVSRVKGKLAGFYTMGNKGVQRHIVLTQTDDGGWEVINEGY